MIYKKRSDVARNKHNFCDPGCYIDFINFEKAGSENQIVCGKKVYRILAGMNVGRELVTEDYVHHADGDHGNHAADNLMVMSNSGHARIHAAKKERDRNGRFVKQG